VSNFGNRMGVKELEEVRFLDWIRCRSNETVDSSTETGRNFARSSQENDSETATTDVPLQATDITGKAENGFARYIVTR